MAHRTLKIIFWLCVLGGVVCWVVLAQAPSPSPSPPSGAIFPITNGKLLSPLDANSFQILNLDTSNLPSGGGGGGGGGGLTSITGDNGSATGLTLSITALPGKSVLTDPVFTLGATLNLANGGTGATTAAGAKAALSLDQVNNTTDANKPVSTATQTALNLKADTTAVNSALALKADTSTMTTALAGKEPTLPTTANDSWLLARHNGTPPANSWFFVDPVSLGTTNQTYTDGSITNLSPTLTSSTANFVPNDVGKAISGTGIPAATTISAVNSTSNITLSHNATATTSPLTFTIYNRIEVGGTGTVTSVTVNGTAGSGSVGVGTDKLLATSVSNNTSSPDISLSVPLVSPGTFYGNPNTISSAAPGFMVPAQALTALGATGAGKALFLMSNPNQTAFPRLTGNPTNAADARTPAQMLTDIGAQPAFSVNAPLTLSGGALSIPAAAASPSPSGTSGYVTGADFIDLKSRVPSGRTLAATAPLLISGGSGGPPPFADLSANRTFSIQQASTTTDGYVSAADYLKFASGSGNAVTAGAGGTLTLSPTAKPPTNRVLLNQALTSPLTIILPPGSQYGNGDYIEIIDQVKPAQTVANRVSVQRAATTADTIDGTVSISIPMGAVNTRLNTDGATPAKWTTNFYYVNALKDAGDSGKVGNFDLSSIPHTAGAPDSVVTMTWPSQNFSGLVPLPTPANIATTSAPAVVTGADGSGNLLTNPITVVPQTTGHNPGESLQIMSGGSYDWAISQNGATQFVTLDGTFDPVVWTCVTGQKDQNATLNLPASRKLQIVGAQSGFQFNLIVKQPAGGNATLTVPSDAMTGATSAGVATNGVITLSTAGNAVDWVKGAYVGTAGQPTSVWHNIAPAMSSPTPPPCNTVTLTSPSSGTGAALFPQTSQARAYLASSFAAADTAICKAEVNLFATGAPNYNLQAFIVADALRQQWTTASVALGDTFISTGGTGLQVYDKGQPVTVSAGFPAGTYYVYSVDTTAAQRIQISTSRFGGSAVAATSAQTGMTVQIFGRPNTTIIGTASNAVSTTSLPTSSVTADAGPGTMFTFSTPITTTVGTYYHLLIGTTATFNTPSVWDASNYITWLYNSSTDTGGKVQVNSTYTTGAGWIGFGGAGSRSARFKLYK